jgi:hypothetical protein
MQHRAAVACRLSCTASTDGCVATSELAPFGVIPEQHGMGIAAVDPDGQYLYFRYGYQGAAVRGPSYRWSAADGVVPLDEWLGVPAIAQKGDEAFLIFDVAPGDHGEAASEWPRGIRPHRQRGVRCTRAFVWSESSGVHIIDERPAAVEIRACAGDGHAAGARRSASALGASGLGPASGATDADFGRRPAARGCRPGSIGQPSGVGAAGERHLPAVRLTTTPDRATVPLDFSDVVSRRARIQAEPPRRGMSSAAARPGERQFSDRLE